MKPWHHKREIFKDQTWFWVRGNTCQRVKAWDYWTSWEKYPHFDLALAV